MQKIEEKIKSEELMMIDVREYMLKESDRKNIEEMKRKREIEKNPWKNHA